MATAATAPFIPAFDKTTSEAARAGAASYLASRLKPSAPADAPFTIPTIDISPSFSSNIEDRKTVAAQIRAACITSGFFTITNHGIPAEVCDDILNQAKRFFHDLPHEKKEAIHMKQSTLHRGYEPPEYTSAVGEAETKEGFNWGYETRLDSTGGDGKYLEVDGTTYPEGANLWPSEADLPGFFEGVKAYYGQVLGLARHMFRLFALSLGLEENHFDEMMTHPGGIARLMHYPGAKDPKPLDPNEKADENLGLGAHSDYECCKFWWLKKWTMSTFLTLSYKSLSFCPPRPRVSRFSLLTATGYPLTRSPAVLSLT